MTPKGRVARTLRRQADDERAAFRRFVNTLVGAALTILAVALFLGLTLGR